MKEKQPDENIIRFGIFELDTTGLTQEGIAVDQRNRHVGRILNRQYKLENLNITLEEGQQLLSEIADLEEALAYIRTVFPTVDEIADRMTRELIFERQNPASRI